MEFNKEEITIMKEALLNYALKNMAKVMDEKYTWDGKDYTKTALNALLLRKRFEDEKN